MENTLGVIIYDITGKVLITKPTNGKIWSFPKGLSEEGEDYKTSAIREVLEETALDLNKIKGKFDDDIYSEKYHLKNKTVHLFTFKSEEKIEGKYEIVCNSFFEAYGKQFPENEDAKWVELEEAFNYVHTAQKSIISRLLKKK